MLYQVFVSNNTLLMKKIGFCCFPSIFVNVELIAFVEMVRYNWSMFPYLGFTNIKGELR